MYGECACVVCVVVVFVNMLWGGGRAVCMYVCMCTDVVCVMVVMCMRCGDVCKCVCMV